MCKRGDAYLRSLAIQGAHAVLRQVRPDSEHPDDQRLQRWLSRHGQKGAAVRLANRNLRIVWVLLQNDQTYRRQPMGNQEAAVHKSTEFCHRGAESPQPLLKNMGPQVRPSFCMSSATADQIPRPQHRFGRRINRAIKAQAS